MTKKSRTTRAERRVEARAEAARAPKRTPSRPPLPSPEIAPAATIDWNAWTNHIGVVGVLAIVTAAFYRPALDAGFLNWDDPAYVTGNPGIRTLDWQTVVWAFTTFQEGIWHPLTWLSLALDYRIYGLQAWGFHCTNLLLHVANTVLVFLVWERLTGALWRSAVVAALFGLHPMHVESVAWVTERKDVLSTFFWLLTMAAYARYTRVGSVGAYLVVLLTFALGLLSKPMLVTLPAALLLLDYWPLRRLSRRAVVEKIPLLVLALAVTAVSVKAVAGVSANAIPDPIPLRGLVGNAIVSCVAYLKLTLWPASVSPWYSHPWFEGPPLTVGMVALAALVLLAISALVVAVAGRHPYAPVGWFWFLGCLLPALGLVYNGRQGMADRYAYIPHIGLFVVLVWAVAELPLWKARPARLVGLGALGVVLLALGARTAQQTTVWHDDRSFWSYTVRKSPYSFIAHQALAILMQEQGRTREATTLYVGATKLRPELPKVHVQLARLLARGGRPGAAAAQYRKAIALDPESPEDNYGLALMQIAQHRPASAHRQLERALELRPGYVEVQKSLAALDAGGERQASER